MPAVFTTSEKNGAAWNRIINPCSIQWLMVIPFLFLYGCEKKEASIRSTGLTVKLTPCNDAATPSGLLQIRKKKDGPNVIETMLRKTGRFSLPVGEYTITVDKGPGYSPVDRYTYLSRRSHLLTISPVPWFDLRKLGWQIIRPVVHVTSTTHEDIVSAVHREEALGTCFLGISANWKLHGRQKFSRLNSDVSKQNIQLVRAQPLNKGFLYANAWAYTQEPVPPARGPLYSVFQKVRRLKGVCAVRFPTNELPEGPSTLKIKHPGMDSIPKKFRHFVRTGLASELPFDIIAGPLFDVLDIHLESDKDIRLWFFLLNNGYRIPAVSSDADAWCLAPATEYGLNSIGKGVTCISNGPVLLFRIAGKIPGERLPADKKRLQGHVGAFLDPAGEDTFTSLEIIRNGKAREYPIASGQRSVDLKVRPIFESEPAWYMARVRTRKGKTALTNPIFFGADSRVSSPPATARVILSVQDAATRPVPQATATIMNNTTAIRKINLTAGPVEFDCPPTAEIIITAKGYQPERVTLFEASGIRDYLLELHSFNSPGAESLYKWSTYEHVKLLLSRIKLTLTLNKTTEDKP